MKWIDISNESKEKCRKDLIEYASEIIESSPNEFIIARKKEDNLFEIIDSLWVNYVNQGAIDFCDDNGLENTYQNDDEHDKGYQAFKKWFWADIKKVILEL